MFSGYWSKFIDRYKMPFVWLNIFKQQCISITKELLKYMELYTVEEHFQYL